MNKGEEEMRMFLEDNACSYRTLHKRGFVLSSNLFTKYKKFLGKKKLHGYGYDDDDALLKLT